MNTLKNALMASLSLLLVFGAAHAATFSDSEITEIMKVANDSEVEAAKLAKKKATSSEVKTFADHMISAHKTNHDEVKKVEKQQKLHSKSTDTSKKIKGDASASMKALKNADKSNFDMSYIQNQIDMHKSLLSELDNSLIPSAKNPELKTYLEKTKADVQEHLSQAEQIKNSLTESQTN